MKKKYKSLVTIFMIFEMFVANLAPVVTLARNDNLKINDPNLKNTVIVTDQSLEDCRRLLEGEAYYTLPLAEKEPVDLVVIQDASGSFEGNFPKLKEAIKELLPEMPSQDRVMLTSYQGGQFYQLANGKVIDNSPGDSPINIKTVTPLTDDKEVFMDGYNSIRPKGTTPTALGLQEALNSYNKAHGDLSKRKTYFLLITDGVANVQLDGKIHKLNNALLEYPAGMFGGTSVEYSSDYKSAAAEVLDLNQQIKSQGYTMINAFWESVNHLSASNSYYDRYKEIGPYVKEELEKGASSPEDFIVGNTIDDFKNQVKELLEQKIHQMPDATSSLLINDKFDIQSVSATDQDGKQLDTKVNGQTIKVVTPGTYTGSVKIKYQLKENAPIDTETIVSSGNLVQGESKVEFPEALIEANEHAHDCDIKPVNPTIEKDIEGKEHLELTNRTDEFDWHINAQFGNETSQWTQAALVDQLNDLLTIKDVKVVDETGKDVSGNGRLTTEKNKVEFTLDKKDGSYSYLSGHTYTMTIKTTISEEATEEALATYSKENGIPNQADLVFGDEGESIHSEKPTVTPPPVNPTIEKDIEGKEHLELTNRTDEFDWHINAQFGNETSQWTQAALVDQLNDLLTIKDVKVVDETGKDVSGNGRLTTEKNKVQFTLAKKDGSYSYLSGHTYTMTIKTTISEEATEEALAAYSKENGIPNQADLVFGDEGESIHSEKPTVTPPSVNPTIEKDVEGKEHLELTNRTDEFDWHINAQFGNETSQWTQAALVDQLNDLLTIKDVKVVDETGKDVSGNGRLTTEKNKVQFTLAKKEGSYSYLSGHTYTITIKTTISEEATEEALAAYSKENGIPNQADLVFGDEGKSIHSEKPTVTPPLNSLDKPKVEKNGLNTNSKRPNKIGMFPNTNSTINYGYIVIGLFLIVIVIFFLFMRINRKK